jgi:hypothetical protein
MMIIPRKVIQDIEAELSPATVMITSVVILPIERTVYSPVITRSISVAPAKAVINPIPMIDEEEDEEIKRTNCCPNLNGKGN